VFSKQRWLKTSALCIVEFEQQGQARAAYGEKLWRRLSADLTAAVSPNPTLP
jgi:hypothetical protein